MKNNLKNESDDEVLPKSKSDMKWLILVLASMSLVKYKIKKS